MCLKYMSDVGVLKLRQVKISWSMMNLIMVMPSNCSVSRFLNLNKNFK